MDTVALIEVAMAAAALVGLVAWFAKGSSRGRGALRPDPRADVAPRAVMTPNELDFYLTLRGALPEMHVLAQVSFGALIEPRGPKHGTSQWWASRNRFGQKVADYVVLDTRGKVACVVELDDRTHERAKDAKRDALLASAGIASLRYESRAKPTAERIRRDLALPAKPATGVRWG